MSMSTRILATSSSECPSRILAERGCPSSDLAAASRSPALFIRIGKPSAIRSSWALAGRFASVRPRFMPMSLDFWASDIRITLINFKRALFALGKEGGLANGEALLPLKFDAFRWLFGRVGKHNRDSHHGR